MNKKNTPKTAEPVFEKFRFPNLGKAGRLRPVVYVPLLYLLALLLALYFGLVHPGLTGPNVELRFSNLSGDSSLYIDGRYHSNLSFAPGWSASRIILPAGRHTLRIEKAGMEPWIFEGKFRANIWNNRRKPRIYAFTVQMAQAAAAHYLWQEAWRAYLYRGLEGQKERSFDASHPYPPVLSEGLRSVFYSHKTKIPAFWSADFQRGLASTTNIYQWADILTAYSLTMQQRANHPRADASSTKNSQSIRQGIHKGIGLLAPKSIALLSRTAVKRLVRLQPGGESLLYAWKRATKETPERTTGQTSIKEWLETVSSLAQKPKSSLQNEEAKQIAGNTLAGQIVLEGIRFIVIPGQNFAVQQTAVTNAQFARFWFGKLRANPKDDEANGVAELALDSPDNAPLPWGWPETAGIDDILQNRLLQDQPVRGIKWAEANAFAAWLQQRLDAAGASWQITLPKVEERRIVFEILDALPQGPSASKPVLDFLIPEAPPGFSQQEPNRLGLQGLGGVLWEWLAGDYLPFPAERSENGSSNLQYKAVAGGSWLNALPIESETRDLWTAEFLAAGNELPFAATPLTTSGQFAALRSPYTGFRLIAREKLDIR